MVRAWFAVAFLSLISAPVAGAETYALVAAMGNQFFAVHEEQQIGSRLPPWRKRALEVKDDGINKVVLASLDQAVSKMHPQSERTYITVRLPEQVLERPRSIEEGAFETVMDAL